MGWTDRQRNILDFTLSSLLRRKGKNAALAAVYTAVVFLLASVLLFTHSIKREAASVLRGAPEILVQTMQAGRHALSPEHYMDRIRQIRGVAAVSGRLWGYYYDPAVGANYTLMADPDFSHPRGSIVIGSGISISRGLYVGERITFRGHAGQDVVLKVTDVFSPESGLVSADLILISEEDLRDLFGISAGYVTDIAISVRNPRELTTIAEKIVGELPDTRPIIRDEILRTYEALFNWRSGIMAVVLVSTVAAFVILAWDKASGLSSEEKREIGILKAIGWETSDVMLMKFWEGAVVSLSSFLVGSVLAYVHVFFASSALFESALMGWSVLYPNFKLVPEISLYQISVLFFLTVVPYTVATVVPSWRAATVDPDSVMRT
jgi:ABC-type lipoprotein release transport system permease subunit